MEKTNSEPLPEAKATAAAGSEEKQNTGGTPKANPVKRTIAVIVSAICILSLEVPWLVNHPSTLKLSFLLALVILVGMVFGFGLTVPDEHEKDNGISGWPLAGFYLLVSISAGLIYLLCPGSRINGWLYVLINLVEAVVAGLLSWFFCILLTTNSKSAKILAIPLAIAAGVGAVYLGWPILQNNSLPAMALLLPGIALAEAAVSGLFVSFSITFIMLGRGMSKIGDAFALLLAIAVAAVVVYLGWPCLQTDSSPVMAMLLPGILLCGSSLAGLIGHLVFLPAELRNSWIKGFREGLKKD